MFYKSPHSQVAQQQQGYCYTRAYTFVHMVGGDLDSPQLEKDQERRGACDLAP
jgi:hypothetical protein